MMEVKYIDSVTSEVIHYFNATKDDALINLPRIGENVSISDEGEKFYIEGTVMKLRRNYRYSYGQEFLHDVIITIKQNKIKKV